MAKKVDLQDRHTEDATKGEINEDSAEAPICGVIRPIAPTDGYSTTHWAEVGEIISESIRSAGFQPRLVSDADNVAVIHGTIVQNIFDDQIIVCDVSSRNPNVMFELGMRLAFDKPVVIVKDEATTYSFDTGLIEHVGYPKSLHYHEIRAFKEKLSKKILATAEKAQDPDHSPFLRHFRHISPKKLQNEDVTFEQFILNKLDRIDARMIRMLRSESATINNNGAQSGKLSHSTMFTVPPSLYSGAERIVRKLAPNASTSYDGNLLIVGDINNNTDIAHLAKVMSMYLEGAITSDAIDAMGKKFRTVFFSPATEEPLITTEVHKLPD